MFSCTLSLMLWLTCATSGVEHPVTAQEPTTTHAIALDCGTTGTPISKYVYSQFIEHLGRCIYGGIWAEMLEDRKFFFPVTATYAPWSVHDKVDEWDNNIHRKLTGSPWRIVGPPDAITMVTTPYREQPIVEITRGTTSEPVGIEQLELALQAGQSYVGRIVLAGDRSVAPITVQLSWGEGADAAATLTIPSLTKDFTKEALRFTAGGTTDNGCLRITSLGTSTFRIAAVSLMPADNIGGFRRDTIGLMRELAAPLYRWPGGNFVSGYDWRDGIGDPDARPTRQNPAWTGIEPNDVGIAEFAALCSLLEAEPMVCVNTGFGDAYSAAAQVEYANGGPDTHMGGLRRAHGYADPFAIKWWCVGNEMFGNWQLGYMQLKHYVLKHNWVESKMRAADSGITTVGVGQVGDWTEGMLRSSSRHMDFISEHLYCKGDDELKAHVAQAPLAIRKIVDAHRKYRKELPQLATKTIPVIVDEWNYWYGPFLYGQLGTRYFMKDALGIARGMHEFYRSTDVVFMANYAQTVNVIGAIKTTKTRAQLATTGQVLALYRHHYGTHPVAISGAQGDLDIAAALTEDRKALTIGVVNPTPHRHTIALTTTRATLTPEGTLWQIQHDDPLAYNEPGKEPPVVIKEHPALIEEGTLTVAPMSISICRFPVQ